MGISSENLGKLEIIELEDSYIGFGDRDSKSIPFLITNRYNLSIEIAQMMDIIIGNIFDPLHTKVMYF